MKMPLFQMASCCFSCFKGGFIVIVRMRSSMIVRCVSKFFYCCIQSFFCLVFMLIDQFIFLRVEISFHWCIIIWISGFIHTLCDCHPLTVFCKIFRSHLLGRRKTSRSFIRRKACPASTGGETTSGCFLCVPKTK